MLVALICTTFAIFRVNMNSVFTMAYRFLVKRERIAMIICIKYLFTFCFLGNIMIMWHSFYSLEISRQVVET